MAQLPPTPDLEGEICRRSFATFTRKAWPVLEPSTPLDWNWHHDLLCAEIQALFESWAARKKDPDAEMVFQNLLVNVPPGTMKSRIISVFAPVWAWTRWPEMTIRCLSANPRVATRDSMLSRELLMSLWYQRTFRPAWKLRDDLDGKEAYGNTAHGVRYATGMVAKVIGERTDVILIDDPHDPADVHSDAKRREPIEKYRDSLHNRVNDMRSSIRLCICQRAAEDDLSAFLLSLGWRHVNISVDEPSKHPLDPRTKNGESMHPVRFPGHVLAAEKKRLGSLGYATQYQQRPAPLEGNLFKRGWWRFFNLDGNEDLKQRPDGCTRMRSRSIKVDKFGRPELDWFMMSIDCAVKKKSEGSRTALMIIGGKGADRFVIDVMAEHLDYVGMKAAVVAMKKKHPYVTKIVVEDKAAGPNVVEELSNTVPGMVSWNPGTDEKGARAMSVTPQIEAGNVYLLDGARWIEDFVYELSLFPNGKKDDQVDTLSMALINAGSLNRYSSLYER